MHERIPEKDLVIPALFFLDLVGGEVSTTDLISGLRKLLQPRGEDLKKLENRGDDAFSQKVRNLVSHSTLENAGFAVYQKEIKGFKITQMGRELISQHRESIVNLLEFSMYTPQVIDLFRQIVEEKEANISILPEYSINEGLLYETTIKLRTRSKYLRDCAVEHYSNSNQIVCNACEFEFRLAYSNSHVDGFIEIHHLIPICDMTGESLSVEEAVLNVRPLCANCHRVVHFKKPPISINELRSMLNVNYVYG